MTESVKVLCTWNTIKLLNLVWLIVALKWLLTRCKELKDLSLTVFVAGITNIGEVNLQISGIKDLCESEYSLKNAITEEKS